METILQVVIILGVILFSMILHELAHGGVAFLLGDNTAKAYGRLTLNPLKHLDPVLSVLMPLMMYFMGGPIFGGAKPVPVNTRNLKGGAWGMALVAVAGPLTNFLLAFVFFLIGHFTGWLYLTELIGIIMTYAVMINIGFGIFNLIPVQPLDGSRILYAIAPDGIRSFMDRLEPYGMYVVIILVYVFSGLIGSLMSSAMLGVLNGFYWIVNL